MRFAIFYLEPFLAQSGKETCFIRECCIGLEQMYRLHKYCHKVALVERSLGRGVPLADL